MSTNPSDSNPKLNPTSNPESESKPEPRKVKCPRCGTLAIFSSENPYRPFCSDRCKLIDLGQWANEDFKIPAVKPPELDELPTPESEEDYDA